MTQWQRFTHEEIEDLEKTMMIDIANAPTKELTWYIGSDSQVKHGKIKYITAIVILFDGKGGRGYYKEVTEKLSYKISIRQKIFQETHMSVETAIWLNPILEKMNYCVEAIHADVSDDPINASNAVMNECLGYIRGSGFAAVGKPDSWAAMEIADRFSK